MGHKWRNFRVEDVAAKQPNALATGPFGSAISAKFFVGEGVPVIRGSNLSTDIGVRLIDENMVFVSPEKAKEFSRSLVKCGDLVFTCWGTISQVGLIDEKSRWSEYIVSNKQMKLTVDPEKANSTYIYYVFSSPEKQQEIISNAIGAAVPGFNLGQLKKHMLRLPPLETQEAIVRRIQSIDDKIDLNRRINQTLEAMAQAIFRSWFIDFDPVKAKMAAIEQGQDPLRAAMSAISGKTDVELDQMSREDRNQLATTAALFPEAMEESELGRIPKGWKNEKIGCYFDLTMGQSPPGNTYNESGEGMPFYQGRTDFGVRFPAERVYCTAPTRLAKKRDVLVSVRAPVGDINVAVSDCAIGRGVAAVRYEHPSFALYVLRHQESAFKRFESDGTVFGSINRKQFESLPFVVSPDELVRRFQSLVGPLDEEIESNEWQVRNLIVLRDTILPKLLSGELSVDNFIAENV